MPISAAGLRYIASLQKGLGEMDAEYDRYQLVYSTGESSLWKDGFLGLKMLKLNI